MSDEARIVSAALFFVKVCACAAPARPHETAIEAPFSNESQPASATSTTASSAPTASVRAEPSSTEWPPGALLTYRESDLAFAFTPPRTVTRLGDGKPCSYELSDKGNVYSGAEVEQAWRNADAQAAVGQSKAFMPPRDLSVQSEARGQVGRIAWTPFCGGVCIEGPPGVVALLRVLHGVAVNARGVCKD